MNNGSAIVVAATILGLSVIGGSYMLSGSVEQMNQGIEKLTRAAQSARIAGAAGAPSEKPAPTRRRGPDPDRVYAVDTKGGHARGPKDAKVTIVEFSDFQCPFCGRVGPTLEKVLAEYPDEVRVVFKHLPLRNHAKAPKAHAAAEAAGAQGRFWEMHDLIFSDQRGMSEAKYIEYAASLGLEVDRFKADMASPETKKRVDADAAEAAKLGVTGTPGFFINGKFMSGAKPYAEFERRIDEALRKG